MPSRIDPTEEVEEFWISRSDRLPPVQDDRDYFARRDQELLALRYPRDPEDDEEDDSDIDDDLGGEG